MLQPLERRALRDECRCFRVLGDRR